MDHAFNTNIAAQYDVNIAILLHNFKFWTFTNLANKRNIYDGLCWSYDTLEALGDIFPYWTRRQLERVINNAVEAKLLQKGNYNQTKYDRTVWYALTPKAYAYYSELLREKYLKSLYLSISPNGEIDFAEWRNRFPKTVTPIPDTDPDTDPNINISTSDEAHEDDDLNEVKTESDNQALRTSDPEGSPLITGLITKSDNQNNQTKNNPSSRKITQFDLNIILKNNEFQIPTEMIQDWITNRNKKRAPVTKTAWLRITKVLSQLKQRNIDPIEAFERMVAAGWLSIEVNYFENEMSTKKQERPKEVNQSPLSNEEDALIRELIHVSKNGFDFSLSLKSRIEQLLRFLQNTNHPIARNAVAEIHKHLEIIRKRSIDLISRPRGRDVGKNELRPG